MAVPGNDAARHRYVRPRRLDRCSHSRRGFACAKDDDATVGWGRWQVSCKDVCGRGAIDGGTKAGFKKLTGIFHLQNAFTF